MMHFNPAKTGACRDDLSHYREAVVRVEVLRQQVRKAKHAAAESLSRMNEAPEPHDAGNTFFVALLDAHSRDREELFTAMRQLDEACAALRSFAGKTGISIAGRQAAE